MVAKAATAGAKDVASALDASIELLAADLEASNWDNGCPVAAVALESPSEAVRAVAQVEQETPR